MNRTIYIGNPAYLKCKDSQLKVVDPEDQTDKASIPIEDIAFLILDHPQITITHHLMVQLQGKKVAIISCDTQHLPQSIQLPLAGHSEHTERIIQQSQMSEPLRKNLWKQTVEAKISNQALLVKKIGGDAQVLFDCSNRVLSGDLDNREGVAAKYYWSQLFRDFVRDRYGEMPNHFLNFGYAILRSAIARSLCSSGFHLALGIHHRSKYNATCLADDIMEPYRPFVDEMVLEWIEENKVSDGINLSEKAHLLRLMQKDLIIDGKTRPLLYAATVTSASLYKCMIGEQRMIRYPQIL